MLFSTLLPVLTVFAAGVSAQLSGRVGATTSIASKTAKKVCNVLNYGAVADKSTDLGAAISKAFAACKSGGVVYIPPGDYAMATFVTLSGGTAWALQLDGVIYRTGTGGGNMIAVSGGSDFEMFSSTGKGAIQGLGYAMGGTSGPRIMRFISVSDFSVHDLALVDAPAFHFTMATCKNGEVYNLAVRGRNQGGLDGIDIWSDNIWVHDVMVTNKDECVTVKSPSHNILVENVYCNSSGGSAFGSLSTGTDISNILYRKVYSWSSNQMMMIKSSGGSGTVKNVLFDNFIGHGNAYSLDIDQYWSKQTVGSGDGVQLQNITFNHWRGTNASGGQRAVVKLNCADTAPCTGITISDFSMWTDSGSSVYATCRSAYGTGFCMKSGTGASYAQVTQTVSSKPADYSAPKMAEDLPVGGFGTTSSIPIPDLPKSYFPGVMPISPLGGAGSAATAVASAATATARARAPRGVRV